MTKEHTQDLYDDFNALKEKYEDMPTYKFGLQTISFAVKMLLEIAPNENIARDSISYAVFEGKRLYFKSKAIGKNK